MISKKKFFRAVGYEPHPGQERIHGAVEKLSTVVVACGARFGKTMAAAHEMAYQAILPRKQWDGEFMGWCVAPTHVLADIVFDTVRQILNKFLGPEFVRFNNGEGLIEIRNLGGGRSRIMRRSTDNAGGKQDGGKAKLVGYAVDFMVVDEASAIVDDSIWENQLRTRLIDHKGRSLHISTPRGTRGYFAKLFRAAGSNKDIASIRLPTWANPYVDKEIIKKERDTMPAKAFAQEIEALFIAADGLVFDNEVLALISCLPREGPRPDGDYFAGWDVAIKQDFSVLTIMRGPLPDDEIQCARIVAVDRVYRLGLEEQISRTHALLTHYNNAPVNVDETGVGDAFLRLLINSGISARGKVWTPQSKRNMVNNTVALLEQERILLLAPEVCPAMFDEMQIYGWEDTPSGKLTSNAPSGTNDDCVASLVMACAFIPAGGSATTFRVVTKADSTSTAPQNTGQIQVSGLALPEAPVPGIWTGGPSRKVDLWRNSLFGT